MAIKSEISWKRRAADGNRIEVYARRVGAEWRFHRRQRRHDIWQRVEEPPIEDWIELIDAIERRIPRRLYPPDELDRVRRTAAERFPDADWGR